MGAACKYRNVSVSLLPTQCLASGKEASGKARSKVVLAGSPLTAWRRWRTAPRKESKVMRTPQHSLIYPRVFMGFPDGVGVLGGRWEDLGQAP